MISILILITLSCGSVVRLASSRAFKALRASPLLAAARKSRASGVISTFNPESNQEDGND